MTLKDLSVCVSFYLPGPFFVFRQDSGSPSRSDTTGKGVLYYSCFWIEVITGNILNHNVPLVQTERLNLSHSLVITSQTLDRYYLPVNLDRDSILPLPVRPDRELILSLPLVNSPFVPSPRSTTTSRPGWKKNHPTRLSSIESWSRQLLGGDIRTSYI